MSEIFENFFHPEHLIYPVTPQWAIVTFIRLFDSLIHQYRNEKYADDRVMRKIFNRIAIEKAHAEKELLNHIRQKRRQINIDAKRDDTRERIARLKS